MKHPTPRAAFQTAQQHSMRERWTAAEHEREIEELRHERLLLQGKLRRRERLAREEREPKSR